MEQLLEEYDEEYLRLHEQLEEVIERRKKIVSEEEALRAQIEVLRRARIHVINEGEVLPVAEACAAHADLTRPSPKTILVPAISDHAMVRYLERHYDFNFQELKASLLTGPVRMACEMGAQSVKAHGGRWTIRNGVVTTFLTKRRASRKAGGPRVSRAQRLQDFQTRD